MALPQPFSLDVPEKTIAEIRTRVAAFPGMKCLTTGLGVWRQS